ncbi:class I SAM-dependent methyltransferase [Aliidiomarina celeris]|uniref:class I SAM-dependent methyltransferase n=1 Tax=Aliidiomarina celeris TaxID=2249428 RepID=UPI000DE82FAD|nr:class I SAM-dependent methyltransferase [Aliidiomarina celeris]
MKCRHCQNELTLPLVDLGVMPPSNAYLSQADLTTREACYPLKVSVCQHCWLVQTEDFTRADQLFTEDYAYFSSTSASWLEHARRFADATINKLSLNKHSFVVELASNDGYLLKNYVEAGIPCLGVEPTAATAAAARKLGINVVSEFFGEQKAIELAKQYQQAGLIVANNVLAHVPDINDFVKGIAHLLAPEGCVSVEFPHLLNLLQLCQFDTIYHEHYSYLSLYTVQRIFARVGLRVFHVEQLSTHGGSLRVWLCHEPSQHMTQTSVSRVLEEEKKAGLQSADAYSGFQARVDNVVKQLKCFFSESELSGKTVLAYGAAAKGNTLLNYAGIKKDQLAVVADAAPSKQGKFLPGSHVPIVPPAHLADLKPDYVVILPWNISTEIIAQLKPVLVDSVRFITAIPELKLQ